VVESQYYNYPKIPLLPNPQRGISNKRSSKGAIREG
jgi:hypothetical protein